MIQHYNFMKFKTNENELIWESFDNTRYLRRMAMYLYHPDVREQSGIGEEEIVSELQNYYKKNRNNPDIMEEFWDSFEGDDRIIPKDFSRNYKKSYKLNDDPLSDTDNF